MARLLKLATLAMAPVLLAACQATETSPAVDPAQVSFIGPQQCAAPLEAGPPAKPGRLRDFGTTTAWNVGRGVGRTVAAGAGTMVAGPVGAAAAGALANRTLRSEYDMRGRWMATDGNQSCACALEFHAEASWTGAAPSRGRVASGGCNNPLLASVDDWRLDETMTGLDAELLVYAANGNRVGVLSRDGADYYSGRLSNGTPLTVWRDQGT